MKSIIHVAFVSLLVLVILGAGSVGQAQKKPDLMIREIASPAGANSGEPNLSKGPDGRVYLSWIEKKNDNTQSLQFAIRSETSWSPPQTIVEAENLVVNWADFPSIVALPDGALVAHWLVRSSTEGHAYDINISRSTDGGKTWSKPITPHNDGTKTEHGFVSMWPMANNKVGAAWLDGRNFKSSSHESHGPTSNNVSHGASTSEMTLRYTAIDANGKTSDDAILDSRVCECCQTSAAVTSDGPIIVYRDRSEKEIRDISVVRFIKGRWTEPKGISMDGWEIQGCPVNGPSVSADGRRVAVAWFTAAKDSPRVKIAFSTDAGATFSQAIQVDEGTPVGRVDVLMLSEGSALVSWLEKTTKGGEVKVRRVRSDGSRDEAMTVSESSAARSSGFPQMALGRNEIILSWTDPGSQSRVRTAVTNLASLRSDR